MAALCSSIPIDGMPKTYVDAIEVARTLGVNYLWVDSLCIVQDDVNDWRRESAQMSDIYSNAFLTIAASASSDDRGGLFYTKIPAACFPFHFSIANEFSQGQYLCHKPNAWYDDVERSAVNSRAWVLQERLLSPRILHFTSNQVYWECGTTRGPGIGLDFPGNNSIELRRHLHSAIYGLGLNRWRESSTEEESRRHEESIQPCTEIVQQYTDMRLTYESDRLPAISGLARRLWSKLNLDEDDYLAGLSRKHLPAQLLWFRSVRPRPVHRTLNFTPSWSWASVNFSVIFLPCEISKDFKILSASVNPVSQDPFGQVSSGQLLIQGRMCSGTTMIDQNNRKILQGFESISVVLDLDLLTSSTSQTEIWSDNIVLLMVALGQGLILCHDNTGRALQRLGWWRRRKVASEEEWDDERWAAETFAAKNTDDPSFYEEDHGGGVYTVRIV